MSDNKSSFDDLMNLLVKPNYLYNNFLHPDAPTPEFVPSSTFEPIEPQPLTADDVRKAVEYLKKQSDDFWANPYKNTCGLGFPHVISPTVYKNGGYTFCANCFEPLRVEPHE